MMIWTAVGGLAVLIGAFLFWRHRKRRQIRLIAFVGLLREHVPLDPTILARLAGRVWKADLGDGTGEGSDGFVVGAGPINTIIHDHRMFLLNSFPEPYTRDVEKEAESIIDLRARSLFLQHRAWFSCDAMGVDRTTSEQDVLDWYRRLGQLFAELIDENCLLLYLPDCRMMLPINDDTEMALRSADPLKSLRDLSTVPIVEVHYEGLMKNAVEKARQGWPQFVAAFESQAGDNFAIKAPLSHGDNTEYIWITVKSLEGDRVYGELANDPGDLGTLKLGSKVSVPLLDLNDWCYQDAEGKLVGGFTIEAIRKASRRGKR